jgi:hypothetical protein
LNENILSNLAQVFAFRTLSNKLLGEKMENYFKKSKYKRKGKDDGFGKWPSEKGLIELDTNKTSIDSVCNKFNLNLTYRDWVRVISKPEDFIVIGVYNNGLYALDGTINVVLLDLNDIELKGFAGNGLEEHILKSQSLTVGDFEGCNGVFVK